MRDGMNDKPANDHNSENNNKRKKWSIEVEMTRRESKTWGAKKKRKRIQRG